MTIENDDRLLVNRGSTSYQIKYEKIKDKLKQDIEDGEDKFAEAPVDGKQYGRQDEDWTEIVHTPEYTDGDVDAHLNITTATPNKFLGWSGSDYEWKTIKIPDDPDGGGDGTADTVSYTHPGGQDRTVQSRLEDYTSVKDFGAKGDGNTDDTVSIQAAIDWVGKRGGGTVYFPAGTYSVKITGKSTGTTNFKVCALTCPYDGVHLLGSGIDGTTVRCKDTNGDYGVIQFVQTPLQNGNPKIFNSSISNMTIDGRYTGTRINGITTLQTANLSNFKFENLVVKNSAFYGIGMQNGGFQNVILENVTINRTTRDGLDLKDNGGNSYGIRLNNVSAINCGTQNDPSAPFASLDLMGEDLQLSNIYIGGNTNNKLAAALRLKQGVPSTGRGWGGIRASITNIVIDGGNGERGIHVKAPGVSIYGAKVRGSWDYGVDVMQGDFSLTGSYIAVKGQGVRFTAVSGSNNADYPIKTGGDFSVVDSTVIEDGTIGVNSTKEHIRVTNCKFKRLDTGIKLQTGVDYTFITGNYFDGSVKEGIDWPQNKDLFILNNINLFAPGLFFKDHKTYGKMLILQDHNGRQHLTMAGRGLGFYGSDPVAKQVTRGKITGGSLEQLQNVVRDLIENLDQIGLLTNGTT